jgi:hypothetical protein
MDGYALVVLLGPSAHCVNRDIRIERESERQLDDGRPIER